MAQPVLDDADFRVAVAYAKGLAKKSRVKELSPLLLLCGFSIANTAGKLAEALDDVTARDSDITKAGIASGLKLAGRTGALEDGTFPTDGPLRVLIKQSGGSVGELVGALLGALDDRKTRSSQAAPSIDTISKALGFDEIVGFASAVGRIKGLKDISPELFTAGALLAYRQGLLRQRPAVCAHLASNEVDIDALIGTHGWNLDKSSAAGAPLPLAASIGEALKAGAEDSDPLIVALNAGIGVASKILAKKRIAYHESGHAVISHVLRPALRITQVTIIDDADSGSDGRVAYDTTSPYFRGVWSREGFQEDLCVSLAGRVSEQKKYGHDEIDEGASADLDSATTVAWNAIAKWGLDFEFGPVSLVALAKTGDVSEGWLFDQAQRRLQEVLKESLQRTETLTAEHWAKIEAVAQLLFEKKRLTEDDLLTVMATV